MPIIVKCLKCGKGHMKPQKLSVVGNNRLKSIVEQTSIKYNNKASMQKIVVCTRCGYIEGVI